MNRNLKSQLETDYTSNKNSSNNKYSQYQINNDNQQIELTQVLVDYEFDEKIKNIQNDLDDAKKSITKMEQLGTQLKVSVSTTQSLDINKNLERLGIETSSKLRDVGAQLLRLNNETKSKPKDKYTNIRISCQRKISNDLKQTTEQYYKVKYENQTEAYKKFKRQYMITHENASETEIRQSFEENNGWPVFLQEFMGISQNSTQYENAFQESKDRNAEMKRIEQSIEDLLYTFQDMQNMLVTQNEVLVSIEDNVDEAEDKVQQGSNELVKAVKIRKNSRKTLWIITAIIFVILLLIGIYIYINTRTLIN